MTTTKAKLEFVHAMARHTTATVRQCEALMRFAHTLKQLLEWEKCDRLLDKAEAYHAKRLRIANRILDVCNAIGPIHVKVPHGQCEHCKHYGRDCTGNGASLTLPVFSGDLEACNAIGLSGDPRGAVLKIRTPDNYSNDSGGEGIVVPS